MVSPSLSAPTMEWDLWSGTVCWPLIGPLSLMLASDWSAVIYGLGPGG